jgi:hypothetical protein
MDTQRTVRVAFRVILLGKLVLYKGLWIVLPGICTGRGGIQANEGRVYNAQLIELFHLYRHEVL